MNHEEIKQYVVDTIRKGDKKRIAKVLKRYNEWLEEQKENEQDRLFKTACDVFRGYRVEQDSQDG